MFTTRIFLHAAALAAFSGVLPIHALADGMRTAAGLSAALGGSLGDGMADAGSMGHGKLDSAVEFRPGRSEAFRRRVAFDTLLTANASGSLVTGAPRPHNQTY